MPSGYSWADQLGPGIARGLQIGANLASAKNDIERQKRLDAQQEQNAALGRLNTAFSAIGNKNIPNNMKVDIWNSGIVPAWNKIYGSSHTGDENDVILPELNEWHDSLNDYVKKAQGILSDKKMNLQQKSSAMSALVIEAGSNDVNIAPIAQQLKQMRVDEVNRATLRAKELMQRKSTDTLTDAEVTEFAQIRAQFPKAVIDAAGLIDAERKARGKPLSRLAKEADIKAAATARHRAPAKYGTTKILQGNEIVTYQTKPDGTLGRELGRGKVDRNSLLSLFGQGGGIPSSEQNQPPARGQTPQAPPTPAQAGVKGSSQQNPVGPMSQERAAQLPSGTYFMDLEGKVRRVR